MNNSDYRNIELRTNQPEVPLPDWEEGGSVDSGTHQPVTPLPDWEEGGPVDSGAHHPVIPLPDWEEGGSVYSGTRPNWNIITIPIRPIMGVCRVRFLNASATYSPLRILIGSRLITSNLPYANMTTYNNIQEGFRTVTITSAASPRIILFQGKIPFNSAEVITLAIIRSINGLELLRISDAYTLTNPMDRGGIRLANLAYNSPPLDLFLVNGRAVFSDVRYKEVTLFKQASPRKYEFYLAQTPYFIEPRYSDIETIEDMPIVMPYGAYDSIARFSLDIKAGIMYTIYILGNWPCPIMIKVVNNL